MLEQAFTAFIGVKTAFIGVETALIGVETVFIGVKTASIGVKTASKQRQNSVAIASLSPGRLSRRQLGEEARPPEFLVFPLPSEEGLDPLGVEPLAFRNFWPGGGPSVVDVLPHAVDEGAGSEPPDLESGVKTALKQRELGLK